MEKLALAGGNPVSRRKIKFVELYIGDEEKRVVQEILRDRSFVYGEYIEKLEKEFARYVGTKYAIAVSNGTDSLFLIYLALGLTFGARVITTPVTFVATASTIVRAGGVPIFADVRLSDGNIDPSSVAEAARSHKIDGIVVVHLYGKPVDMSPILELADDLGIPVVEDAAHAHGAVYRSKKAGAMGVAGSFSLYPAKIMGTAGWGGLITTNDRDLRDEILLMRAHGELSALKGREYRYVHVKLGFNMRISHIEAAVAYFQLKRLEDYIAKRRKLSRLLSELLEDVPGIKTPEDVHNGRHVFYIYNVLLDTKRLGISRDFFVNALVAEGIEARKGYHIPLHKQELFARISDPKVNFMARVVKYPDYSSVRLPIAEEFCSRSIWLPMHPLLTEEDIHLIAKAVRKVVNWALNR